MSKISNEDFVSQFPRDDKGKVIVGETETDAHGGTRPPMSSGFSLEAENAMLKEQLERLRKKVIYQRRELRRLNRGYTLMLHASDPNNKWKKTSAIKAIGDV